MTPCLMFHRWKKSCDFLPSAMDKSVVRNAESGLGSHSFLIFYSRPFHLFERGGAYVYSFERDEDFCQAIWRRLVGLSVN